MEEKKAYYHWLYALFPVIYLYSYNIEEVIPKEVFLPLVASFLAGILLWGIYRLFVRNPQKTALLTFLTLFMVFTFGHVLNIIGYSQSNQANRNVYLVFLWIAVFIGLSILAIITRKNMNTLTRLLNVFILLLFLISVGKVVLFHAIPVKIPVPDRTLTDTLRGVDAIEKNDLPDIYYLIFDRYAGVNTLKEYFHFDNKEFISYLEGKGFYLASDSLCNYPETYLSLSSSLNMQFQDYLLREGPVRKSVIYRVMEDFKVWRLLKSAGYRYLHFGSWWGPTKINRYADVNFRSKSVLDWNQDFMVKVLESTIFSGFFKGTIAAQKEQQLILETFDKLAEVPFMEGPKFVFAHILLPHRPFWFDAGGESLKPALRKKRTNDENYLNQLKFTNMKIMWLVSEILEKSSNPPVIVIQSDEGPREKDISARNMRRKYTNRYQRRRIRRMMRYNILNSYYLPGIEIAALYSHITPVNSFRVIFNHYFGTDFELLEDKSYLIDESKDKLNELTEIHLR